MPVNVNRAFSLIIAATFAFIIAFSLFGGAIVSASASEDTPKIVVLDFKTTGDSADFGETVAETLRAALKKTGKYVVVKRGILRQTLEEQKLSLTGGVDQKTVIRIGKVFRADFIAVGIVANTGGSYSLNVRFVDVETGEAIFGKKLTFNTKGEIPALCAQIVKLLEQDEVEAAADAPAEKTHPRLQPLSKPKASRMETPSGNWAIGLIYPGGAIRYRTSGKSAWELKGQTGSGILAVGARYYCYLNSSPGPLLFLGGEGDYLTFKGKVSKGSGFAGGAFAGGELPITDQISLATDFGAMYLSLSDENFSQTASGLDYVLNFGIYYSFK